jgi:hypothetical protein
MRSLKDILRLSIHALSLPTAVWAITSITSCAHTIRPPEAAASALVPVLETRIIVQSDERPGIEYAAFDLPETGEAILRAENGAKIDASPCRRIQVTKITLNGHVVVKPNTFKKEEKP